MGICWDGSDPGKDGNRNFLQVVDSRGTKEEEGWFVLTFEVRGGNKRGTSGGKKKSTNQNRRLERRGNRKQPQDS